MATIATEKRALDDQVPVSAPKRHGLCPNCVAEKRGFDTVDWNAEDDCELDSGRVNCEKCNARYCLHPCEGCEPQFECKRCGQMAPLNEHHTADKCDDCDGKEQCYFCTYYYIDYNLYTVYSHNDDDHIVVCEECFKCADPDCSRSFSAADPGVYYEQVVVDDAHDDSAGLYHASCVKECAGPCGRVVAVGPSKSYKLVRGQSTPEPIKRRPHPFFKLTRRKDAEGSFLMCDDCIREEESQNKE